MPSALMADEIADADLPVLVAPAEPGPWPAETLIAPTGVCPLAVTPLAPDDTLIPNPRPPTEVVDRPWAKAPPARTRMLARVITMRFMGVPLSEKTLPPGCPDGSCVYPGA